MNSGGSRWQGDDFDPEILGADYLGIRGELMASAWGSRIREERGPATHECQRRNFANGPAARDAACLLHQALHLPSPQAVIADFAQRTSRRICYRFVDRNRVAPTHRRYDHLPN
jgi:hypothetical protein